MSQAIEFCLDCTPPRIPSFVSRRFLFVVPRLDAAIIVRFSWKRGPVVSDERWFYRDEVEYLGIYEKLKLARCPHCQVTGTLPLHGFPREYEFALVVGGVGRDAAERDGGRCAAAAWAAASKRCRASRAPIRPTSILVIPPASLFRQNEIEVEVR